MNEYAQPAQKSSSKATTALVLGIIAIVCCGLLGPVAWILGRQELNAIAAGQSSPMGEGSAKAGMILGIIATILLAFGLLWILFFGGMAIVQEAMG